VLRATLIGTTVAALLVHAGAASAQGCRPLRAIFYAAAGSQSIAQALAANPSPCAQYYVSVPPLTADKTQMRTGVAGPIRALGPNFHALAEVNVTAWQGWVTSTGNSWYAAGVEARRRMAAAGFDLSAGDSWLVNEFPSSVRTGAGTSRQSMRDLVHGLYDGDGGPPVKGVVTVIGIGQPTTSLGLYKANVESWLQDSGFWSDMSSYVGDFLQETFGDVRDYGVAGADVPTRLGYLNAYLEHIVQLSMTGPATAATGAGYLQASYGPLANAAWAWTSGYGYTQVPFDQMEDYVSAQVDAIRSYEASIGWSGDRVGFAWEPSNSLGLSATDFANQSAAILARLAAALQASADPAAPGAGACQPPWCTAAVAGAAFTQAWGTFSSWTPTTVAFTSGPVSVAAGAASGQMSIQLQIGSTVTALPVDTDVLLSSSSAGGSFSTSPSGPWTGTLDLTIPAGSTATTFYMLDTRAGSPTVTATTGGQGTTQQETVAAQLPGPPLAVTAVAGDGQATVSFAAPVSDGGADISSYTVTASPGGQTGTSGGSPIVVSGLTDGTSYTFTVTAANAAGTGPASSPSDPVTPIVIARPVPELPPAGPRPVEPVSPLPDTTVRPPEPVAAASQTPDDGAQPAVPPPPAAGDGRPPQPG
jgi:hypothetical protein